jgi:hypothetical protein
MFASIHCVREVNSHADPCTLLVACSLIVGSNPVPPWNFVLAFVYYVLCSGGGRRLATG